MNPLRKTIQKFGFDFHRYRPHTDKLQYLQTFGIKTVLDVGANIGQFRDEIREKLPDAFIYSFEPLKECFEVLAKAEKTDNKFKAFNCALGDKSEKATIHKSSYTLSSSLLPMSDIHKNAFPHTKHSRPEEIEVKKMDNVFQSINLPREILIKVDTQGYEDRVIAGGRETFLKARALIMETSFVSLYEGQQLFADIYATLKEMGFTYLGALHQKTDKKTGAVLFEDSLFVKR